MDGRVKRPDLCNRSIALDWLDGMSQLSLSVKYDCSPQTINTRLQKAKKEFPGLPWGERRAGKQTSSVAEYVQMNDGRPGESAVRQGSVIRSAAMRRR